MQILLVDDLGGSAAEGTVRFGLDGAGHGIDLNAGHDRELRDALTR
jgi:Lsr2